MFFFLAKHADDLEDVYHYIKKINLTSSAYANYINILTGIGSVSFSLLLKFNENSKVKTKIFNKFLQLMREVLASVF
jgi:hypothetical protein